MDNVVKIDLKEQLKSLFDTGINLNVCQIGAIQWAINQVDISKTETTSCEWCEGNVSKYFDVNWYDFTAGNTGARPKVKFCPLCGREVKKET